MVVDSPGDQFLAHARFALDQNRDGRSGGAFQQGKNLLHRGAEPDDLGKRIGVQTLTPQPRDLPREPRLGIPQIPHDSRGLHRQGHRGSQRLEKFQVRVLEPPCSAVDHFNHTKDIVPADQGCAHQAGGLQAGHAIHPGIEISIFRDLVDHQPLPSSDHLARNALGCRKAQVVETRVDPLPQAAGHREEEFFAGRIDQQQRAPLGIQHILGMTNHQGQQLLQVRPRGEAPGQFEENFEALGVGRGGLRSLGIRHGIHLDGEQKKSLKIYSKQFETGQI